MKSILCVLASITLPFALAVVPPYSKEPLHHNARKAVNGTGPTIDLGYAVYQGVANGSTGLNTFKG